MVFISVVCSMIFILIRKLLKPSIWYSSKFSNDFPLKLNGFLLNFFDLEHTPHSLHFRMLPEPLYRNTFILAKSSSSRNNTTAEKIFESHFLLVNIANNYKKFRSTNVRHRSNWVTKCLHWKLLENNLDQLFYSAHCIVTFVSPH